MMGYLYGECELVDKGKELIEDAVNEIRHL